MPASRSRSLDFQTVNPSKGAPRDSFSAHDTNVEPRLLVKPNTGTYQNGMSVTDADYGDADGEGELWQVEIPQVHPQSSTPYDDSTAFGAGDPITCVEVVEGEIYELKCASLSFSKGDLVKCAASGLAEAIEETGTSTYKAVHTFKVIEATSSKTTVLAQYKGYRLEKLS